MDVLVPHDVSVSEIPPTHVAGVIPIDKGRGKIARRIELDGDPRHGAAGEITHELDDVVPDGDIGYAVPGHGNVRNLIGHGQNREADHCVRRRRRSDQPEVAYFVMPVRAGPVRDDAEGRVVIIRIVYRSRGDAAPSPNHVKRKRRRRTTSELAVTIGGHVHDPASCGSRLTEIPPDLKGTRIDPITRDRVGRQTIIGEKRMHVWVRIRDGHDGIAIRYRAPLIGDIGGCDDCPEPRVGGFVDGDVDNEVIREGAGPAGDCGNQDGGQ